MNIEKLIKVIIIDCDTKGMNNDEWDIIPWERDGSKGELLMGINPTHTPKIIVFVYNLLFVDWVYNKLII
jgi:hypothetical protein